MFGRLRNRRDPVIGDGFGEHGEELVSLLLDGNSLLCARLRAQLTSPMVADVKRIVVDGALRYQFHLVSGLAGPYRATSEQFLTIDDLEICCSGGWHPVAGYVSRGILISFQVQGAFDTTELAPIEAYRYRLPTGEHSSKRDAQAYSGIGSDGASAEPTLSEAPQWLRDSLSHASDLEMFPGASTLPFEAPTQLKEFLTWADGGTVNGVSVLGSAEVWEVDLDDHRRGIVINVAASGGLSVVEADSGIVWFVDLDERTVEVLAQDLREWLTNVVGQG